MANSNKGAPKLLDGFFQHLFGRNVQVVGWLVQDKEGPWPHHKFCERQPGFFSPAQDFDLCQDRNLALHIKLILSKNAFAGLTQGGCGPLQLADIHALRISLQVIGKAYLQCQVCDPSLVHP